MDVGNKHLMFVSKVILSLLDDKTNGFVERDPILWDDEIGWAKRLGGPDDGEITINFFHYDRDILTMKEDPYGDYELYCNGKVGFIRVTANGDKHDLWWSGWGEDER